MDNELLARLEQERKSAVPPVIFSVSLGIFGFVFLLTESFVNPIICTICLLVAAAVGFLLALPRVKQYKRDYKDSIVETLFSETFDKVSYLPDSGFSEEMIRGTGLIMLGNRYRSEDLISGSFKGIPFRRSDVLIQEHHQNGKNSYTVTLFQGRWITLNYNRHFEHDLQLIQKGFGYSNKKSTFLTGRNSRRHKVEFENEDFNRAFDCYCQDTNEAFYLLPPHILEDILKYASIADGKVMIGFTGSLCHLAIENGKDTLEPSLFRPVSYTNDILPVKTEVNAIADFINLLNLDRDIYR